MFWNGAYIRFIFKLQDLSFVGRSFSAEKEAATLDLHLEMTRLFGAQRTV